MIHRGRHASIQHQPTIAQRQRKTRRPNQTRIALGKIAYQTAQAGLTWKAIGLSLGVSGSCARGIAVMYAATLQLPWPPEPTPITEDLEPKPKAPTVPKPPPQKPKQKHSRRVRKLNLPALSDVSLARVQEARLRLKEQRLAIANVPYIPAGAPCYGGAGFWVKYSRSGT
jgi:hypothetical protein